MASLDNVISFTENSILIIGITAALGVKPILVNYLSAAPALKSHTYWGSRVKSYHSMENLNIENIAEKGEATYEFPGVKLI